jgi:hypothetical protein
MVLAKPKGWDWEVACWIWAWLGGLLVVLRLDSPTGFWKGFGESYEVILDRVALPVSLGSPKRLC